MLKRIGAGTYTLSMSLAIIAWSVATTFLCNYFVIRHKLDLNGLNFWVGIFGSAVGLLFWPLSAGRMRDLNFSGWSVKVLAFPLIAVIILPVLCFLSGPRWDNDYGHPPNPSGFLKVTVTLSLFVLAVILFYSAIVLFETTRYQLVHGQL